MSKTVSIDEPAVGYMEMFEYRNSAREHLMALEDKSAMEGYLETMMQSTTLKQKAYGTLVLSEMHAETIEQLLSLPWRAVVLRYFEEEMRTTTKIHDLIAIPYVRTELQLRFAWCMIGLTRGEYDSEERKRSKEEKVFLMTSVRDLMTQEEAAVACAKRRDSLCFVRFMIEQISVPAFSTCVKILSKGDERAKALLLLALLDIYQGKPMRVNMKEPVELEPMKKIDKIRRFSNKDMNLTCYPEQMRENARRFDVKRSTDSWNKIRDLQHTLIQYLLQQNRFGTGEDETIEREEDVRRHAGGMPLLTDLSLAMRTDPLALIRGATEFVAVIYGPAVTFAFPDVKVEA